MEKTIEVTITVNKNGEASFYFQDVESGCDNEIFTYVALAGEKKEELANELLSWMYLISEEVEDEETEGNE